MSIKHRLRNHFWQEILLPGWPFFGHFVALVVVAVAILQLTPFASDQLTAFWTGSDLPRSHWPTALLLQRTFAQNHRLPLWNPYYAGGQPLAADSLAALFYPPTQLVHFFSLRDYYLILIMGHLLFAGMGMVLLARRALALSHVAALLAAIAFMATPRLIAHLGAGHITIVQTVAWLPWLALACWATIHNPRRWWVALAICFALTLLAGHPQIAYYGLVMTAGLAAWLLIKRWRAKGWQAMLQSMGGLVAAGVVGGLLAAVYLFPLAEFTARSTRQQAVSSKDTYPLLHFLRELIVQPPLSPSFWENVLTPGLAVLLLALSALLFHWRKSWPLLLGILLIAELAMGNTSWFYLHVSRILPDFDRFRGLSRIWFVALVALALLAGVGTDAFLQIIRRISKRAMFATGFLALFIVTVTLISVDRGYTQTGDVRVASLPSQLARTASQLAGSGRIYDVQDDNISQANAVLLETRLANGWNPLLIQSYVVYLSRAGNYVIDGYQLHIPRYDGPEVQPNATLLGWVHVSVVLSRRPLADPHFVQVGKVNGVFIYRNTGDAGSAYLVSPASSGAVPALNTMHRINILVHTVTETPEQETYTFTTDTPAYLVLAEPAFPGWTARLDGNVVSPQMIARTLPAIKVRPGTHTLSYSYAPSSVRNGAILSGIGLLTILVWLLFLLVWKPRKHRAELEENERETTERSAEPLVAQTYYSYQRGYPLKVPQNHH